MYHPTSKPSLANTYDFRMLNNHRIEHSAGLVELVRTNRDTGRLINRQPAIPPYKHS